jgi:hypothetical protein
MGQDTRDWVDTAEEAARKKSLYMNTTAIDNNKLYQARSQIARGVDSIRITLSSRPATVDRVSTEKILDGLSAILDALSQLPAPKPNRGFRPEDV